MAQWQWELAILLSKLVAYLSFVSLTGGLFVLLLGASPRSVDAAGSPFGIAWSPAARVRILWLLLLASGAGFLSISLFFLLQVGLINENGLAGMLDTFMWQLLAQTPIGAGVILRQAGFLLFALLLLLHFKRLSAPLSPELPTSFGVVGVLGVLLCCAGFAALGHVAGLDLLAQLAIGLHVLAAGLWIGALYPLYTLCRTERASALYPLMKRFGDWAWGITLTLVAAGVYLLYRLLHSPAELLTTAYGQLLALKIVCLLCLLGLAALNKFRLVPALQAAGTTVLQRSIRGEMWLAGLILLLTAILSTVTGPAHLMG